MRTIVAEAPSNIALVKYMGKDGPGNLPANPSISLTLSGLRSLVEARSAAHGADRWVPEAPAAGGESPMLSEAGAARFLMHVERVRRASPAILARFGVASREPGALEIRSSNTFPPASGIASSASSFAALTLATAASCSSDREAFEKAWAREVELRRAFAVVSRQGSGSSCRSFEGPWVVWEGDSAAAIESSSVTELVDLVLLFRSEPKEVSSSDAHHLVRTSPLWDGRVERATVRLRDIEAAIGDGDLLPIALHSWSEAWEMHSLFHTSAEPFTYFEPGTIECLRWFSGVLAPFIRAPQSVKRPSSVPPIVTLDAGPNVHVLVPADEAADWKARILSRFPGLRILEDRQGRGARLLGEVPG